MSYWTFIDLEVDSEDGPPDVNEVLRIARPYIEDEGWAVEPILDHIREGLDERETSFNHLYSDELEGLMLHISEHFPRVHFRMRGRGEEFYDFWIREFYNGKIIFSRGPFEDDDFDEEPSDEVAEPPGDQRQPPRPWWKPWG